MSEKDAVLVVEATEDALDNVTEFIDGRTIAPNWIWLRKKFS